MRKYLEERSDSAPLIGMAWYVCRTGHSDSWPDEWLACLGSYKPIAHARGYLHTVAN